MTAWERGRPRPHAAKMAALQWPRSTARKKMTDTPPQAAKQSPMMLFGDCFGQKAVSQ